MQVIDIPTWGSAVNPTAWFPSASVGDGTCKYVGLAIGPDSDEGLVTVNGVSLAAGQVLPLSATKYDVKGLLPTWFGMGMQIGASQSSVNLQLLLFESVAELSRGNASRAPKSLDGGPVALNSVGGLTSFINIPFCRRKRCRVQLKIADTTPNNFNYRVEGHRWGNGTAPPGAVNSVIITQNNVTTDADGQLAFYIYDEDFDYLIVTCGYTAAPTTDAVSVRTTVSGELDR